MKSYSPAFFSADSIARRTNSETGIPVFSLARRSRSIMSSGRKKFVRVMSETRVGAFKRGGSFAHVENAVERVRIVGNHLVVVASVAVQGSPVGHRKDGGGRGRLAAAGAADVVGAGKDGEFAAVHGGLPIGYRAIIHTHTHASTTVRREALA